MYPCLYQTGKLRITHAPEPAYASAMSCLLVHAMENAPTLCLFMLSICNVPVASRPCLRTFHQVLLVGGQVKPGQVECKDGITPPMHNARQRHFKQLPVVEPEVCLHADLPDEH
jgi:hypothetical protein